MALPPVSVLDEARAVTDSARPSAYGAPPDNHGATGAMVQTYLQRRYGPAARFDALDVCAFNMLQKLSRLANTPAHLDSLVDICGYAHNWEVILNARDVEQIAADARALFATYTDLAAGRE